MQEDEVNILYFGSETLSPNCTCETMDSSNSCDRLSELPDSLILEILSLLPMTDVVPTMLLSKRWLHLWTTVPCLDFKYKSKYEDKYKEFVSGALAHWKGTKIRKFSFTFQLYREIVAMIDSWLLLAIEKQVEELLICDDSQTKEYCLPQRLYSCLSVTKMSLSFCKLRIDEVVQWSQLKILEIEGAESLNEDSMNKILAGAPLLEELLLEYFHSMQNLNIRSISLKILKFSIYYYDDTLSARVVRVWAPNLLDLEIYGYFFGIRLLDVPSLTNAKIWYKETYSVEMFYQFFQSIRHVEKLTLSEFDIKALLRMTHGFEFPNAKFLCLHAGCAEEMLAILHMFPHLTTLRVQNNWDEIFLSKVINSHLSKADLASPSVPFLKSVDITWFMRDISIIPALEILLENAMLLDTMVFRANWSHWDGDKPELLLSNSASSPTAEVTILDVDEYFV